MENYTENKNPSNINPTNQQEVDDEIDLQEIFNTLIRNKTSIIIFTVFGICLGLFNAIRKEPVWQGDLQIVLASNDESKSRPGSMQELNNQILSQLGGVSGKANELATEVEILKSPSVLMPIFDYVKKDMLASGKNITGWKFRHWLKSNLKIELKKGTSVLNISYKDTSKTRINKVLNDMSTAYQKFSNRDRDKGIRQGIDHLDEQILIYKEKGRISREMFEDYSSKYNLIAGISNSFTDKNLMTFGNISNLQLTGTEQNRIAAINEMNRIDIEIASLNNPNINPEIFLAKARAQNQARSITNKIESIDISLSKLNIFLEHNDDDLLALKEERESLVYKLKPLLIGHLEAKRDTLMSVKTSNERPRDVLIKFKELANEAARDENTLIKLESERRLLALEAARSSDPWELITTPTLLSNKVAPKMSNLIILGLLGGFLTGSLFSIVKENKTGIIYNKKKLLTYLDVNLIDTFNFVDLDEEIRLIADGTILNTTDDKKIAFIILGNISEEWKELLRKKLVEEISPRKFEVTENLVEAKACSKQILLTSLGSMTKNEAIKFRNRLSIQCIKVEGLILLAN